MSNNSDATGLAALSICESLLLSLTDLAISENQEAVSILEGPLLFECQHCGQLLYFNGHREENHDGIERDA